jgi:SWI/SNF-related matrix-associated actin-dependent regulator of chromatin subfamily A3
MCIRVQWTPLVRHQHAADYIRSLILAIVSRIFILEPQWNPSVEIQAIGRALSLGQHRPVSVYRYIVQGTVKDVRVIVPQHKQD